jgi:hypothetical protein
MWNSLITRVRFAIGQHGKVTIHCVQCCGDIKAEVVKRRLGISDILIQQVTCIFVDFRGEMDGLLRNSNCRVV